MRVRTCLRCGHTGEALDAGGLCNQLVMRDGHGDTCGCSCTWDKVTIVEDERDGHLGEVIDRRVQVYGNPIETFARIAQVWSGIIGHEIQPVEVPLMMAGMKMVRAQVMPDYSDNSDDIDGYLDIFRKIVGEDMIHARTVNEFIEKKWPAHVVSFDTDADQPVPYTLSEEERAQQLRRAKTVTDHFCGETFKHGPHRDELASSDGEVQCPGWPS